MGGRPPFAEHIRRLFQSLMKYRQTRLLTAAIYIFSVL
jgi:hypothetical protein